MKKHAGLMLIAVGILNLGLSSTATAQGRTGQNTTAADRKARYQRLPRPDGHVETEQEYRMRRVKELDQRLQPYIEAGDRAAALARRTLRDMRLDGEISDAEWEEAKEINRDFPPK